MPKPSTSTGPAPRPISPSPWATAAERHQLGNPRRRQRIIAPRQARGEHRGVRAAGAVCRAAVVPLSGDLHEPLPIEEHVCHHVAMAAGQHHGLPARAPALAAANCADLAGVGRPCLFAPATSARASGTFGVSTVARGSSSSTSGSIAPGVEQPAPDSATITGSSTTGVCGQLGKRPRDSVDRLRPSRASRS